MQTTTFKCDRCGRSETLKYSEQSTLEPCTVGVAIYDAARYYNSSTHILADVRNKQEWCKECCIAIGIRNRYPRDVAEKPEPPLTVEQQLVEVLRCFDEQNAPQPQT